MQPASFGSGCHLTLRKGSIGRHRNSPAGGNRKSTGVEILGDQAAPSPERPRFKEHKKKLSGIERQQMDIHHSRNFSAGEMDQFLWLMLGLIVVVAFAGLYFTGNL